MAGSYATEKQNQISRKKVNGQGISSQKTDSELIQMIAATEDREAFTELFRRYEKLGYRVAKHVTFDHHLAEEALLVAMHRIWRSAHSFKPEGNARGWIIRIIARSSMVGLARKGRRGKQKLNHLEEIRTTEVPSKDDAVETDELLAGLKNSLQKLPTADRHIMMLRFVGGLSQAEIGIELSVSQRTVSERIRRSLATLRSSLNSAGLAAAMPLISIEGINKAISGSSKARASLLDEAVTSVSSTGVRASTFGGVAGISLTVLFMASAFAGFVWQKDRPASEKPPAGLVLKNSSELNKLQAAFHRLWDFNDSGLKDLQQMAGEWEHLSSAGPDGSGCLSVSKDTILRLGINIPPSAMPLELNFNAIMKSEAVPAAILRWGDHNPEATIKSSSFNTTFSNQWLRFQCFITEDKLVVRMKNIIQTVALARRVQNERLVVSFVPGWKIDNLEIRSISPEAVLDVSAFAEAANNISPENRRYFHLLPSLTKKGKDQEIPRFYGVIYHDRSINNEPVLQTQTWRFQKQNELNDFEVIEGAWRQIADGGEDGAGCVEFNEEEVRTFFDCKNRSAPFVITARFRKCSSSRDYGFPALFWINFMNGNSSFSYKCPRPTINRQQTWITMRYYVTNQYIDTWVGNQRASFKLKNVGRFGLPYLYSNNKTQMDFLEIKSIPIESFPKLGPPLRAEVDRMLARAANASQ